MKKLTRQKIEAIMRAETENPPYKYRDVRAMYWYGITPYKDLPEDEVDQIFADLELEILPEDEEWAEYN